MYGSASPLQEVALTGEVGHPFLKISTGLRASLGTPDPIAVSRRAWTPLTPALLQVTASDGSSSAKITVSVALGSQSVFSSPQDPLKIKRTWLDGVKAFALWIEWSVWGYWQVSTAIQILSRTHHCSLMPILLR